MTTILEVLTADHQKNHQGREYDLDETVRRFERYVEEGKAYFTMGKVIIVFNPVLDDTVEFHCINGGDGKDLSTAVIEFLRGMSMMFKTAVTYYDNPRVSDIVVRHSPYVATVQQVDEGLDRTFKATFFLGA